MFKLFRKMKYSILSKIAERKINKKFGIHISIKIKEFKVQQEDGAVKNVIKTEITLYEKDCKKLINVLLKKGQ